MAKSGKKRSDDTEKLDSLRERLYARDGGSRRRERAELKQESAGETPREWQTSREAVTHPEPAEEVFSGAPQPAPVTELHATMKEGKRSRGYRMKLIVGAVGFFVVMLAVSSLFFIFGNNSISGENISVEVSGPFAVGGGEELPLQITIANDNTIPIESATLIIEYPPGTQSAEEAGKEIFTERMQLDAIAPGSVRNIQTSAIVFGEENDEKVVDVSVEYRVQGSNATFYKEAAPLRFKISSSPVVLNIQADRSVSSGQEVSVELTVRSNAPTLLTGVLVKADYPFGFDYSSASPSPVSGRDTWLIEDLAPEEEHTITIHGVITGGQSDERVFHFSVGVPNERDSFALASIFTTGEVEMDVEAPFLGVNVEVNGSSQDPVVIAKGERATVRIRVTNTQDDTVYNGVVEVQLSGNALSDIDVSTQNGHYNSQTDVIRFDATGNSELTEIAPGRSKDVSFMLEPNKNTFQTPEIDLEVTVYGERVFEDNVPQELVATASRTIRVEAAVTLSSSILHVGTLFPNSGPVPPIAEETTEYTLQFELRNGSNDITNAEMTATLPPYVAWTDSTVGNGSFSYNSGTRSLVWNIGNVNANGTESASAQVEVTPSQSQIGRVPTVVETQYFRATDRFTSTVIRDEASALTTATPSDDGRVQAN